MRKFIVSDLHGNGEVYDSMMAFLENIALTEDVELYINGDLIDRGYDSLRMILDVRERIEGKGSVKIHYLGGNHELMMYQALLRREPGKNCSMYCDWYQNGGWVTEGATEFLDNGEEILDSLRDYAGELSIYHVFDEEILGNKLLLVHAQAPKDIEMPCPLKIKDNNRIVFNAVWKRRNEYDNMPFVRSIIGHNKLGKDGYFTIIGHTPVNNKVGFFVHNKKDLYMNIDGGCAAYAKGLFQFDHVPLVEIHNNYLSVLIFNHNNEILTGYNYNGIYTKMGEKEIEKNRSLLDPNLNGNGEKNKQLILELYK